MTEPTAAAVSGLLAGYLDHPDAVRLDAATGDHARVALHVADAAELRALDLTTLPPGVTTRSVAVLLDEAPSAPTLAPRPEWPPLESLRSRRVRAGWWTVLRFTSPVGVAAVVAELGRAAVWGARPVVRPVVRPVAPAGSAASRGEQASYDVRLVNPTGFRVHAPEPAVSLLDLDLGPGPTAVTAGLVERLRRRAGVRVDSWPAGAEHQVVGLALAGVPVLAPDAPPGPLQAALRAPVDLADPLAREEHSVVLRRAAFDAHSGLAEALPSVSVLLATRRREMLRFALAQVDRQRGVASLELVLAPHGFEVSQAEVREHLRPDVALVLRPEPATTLFGDVLEAAARAASGELVLKMDDDDWYGPDVVADLLRAHAYSGAEMVGMSAEMHYLTPKRVTVRRGHPPERYVRFVAGGTTMLSRQVLGEIGGFRPVRKYVDAQLIEALLAAGGAVYRTHGLGYVLRRNATGHTWEVDMDYLLDPARVAEVLDGFAPSRLLDVDPAHLPAAAAAGEL